MQAFCLNIQRCLLHPCFVNLYDMDLVKTFEGYRTVPSCKLESLVEILIHHLAMDNAPGIEPSCQRPSEAFISPTASHLPLPSLPPSPVRQLQQQQQQSHITVPPHKIIIYSYFATSFDLIKMVSSWIRLQSSTQADFITGVETQQHRPCFYPQQGQTASTDRNT
jgi:hypothetical protein